MIIDSQLLDLMIAQVKASIPCMVVNSFIISVFHTFTTLILMGEYGATSC